MVRWVREVSNARYTTLPATEEEDEAGVGAARERGRRRRRWRKWEREGSIVGKEEEEEE